MNSNTGISIHVTHYLRVRQVAYLVKTTENETSNILRKNSSYVKGLKVII